ncbi:hypothetical protein OH77DRAFT_1413115, partial [Trametes cingulata]
NWFAWVREEPDEATGMWIVKPRFLQGGCALLSVVHLKTIVRSVHLIGCSHRRTVGDEESKHTSLDLFEQFCINKYIDHHTFELLHV